MRTLLVIFFLGCVAAHAQNCSTQPAMNTMTMTAAGNNAVVGDTTMNTITVNLDNKFTSATGYVSVYTNSVSYTAPGNNGSYRIISGNGTKQIVLDASATLPNPSRTNGGTTTSGGQSGRYVSDLAVIRNSARNYTFQWSTPGFNSDTWVSYGDDVDSNTIYGTGYVWRSGDTVTGVVNHSITVDNLDLFVNSGSWVGKYTFTVWSNCFTNGVSDVSLSVHLPTGVTAPNQSGSNNGYQKIFATTADVVAGLNTYTMAGYNGFPSSAIFFPPQDGSHPGFRVAPGGVVVIPLNYINTTIPAVSAASDVINATVSDWVPSSGTTGGLLFTYGSNGTAFGRGNTFAWTGQSIAVDSSGGRLTLTIPATVPAAAPCGNVLGAEAIMLDGGTVPACAYPLSISVTKGWQGAYICGGTGTNAITCGPPGTPATPVAQVPVVVKTWVMVFNPTGLVPTGTVGAWINPYTNMPGIPCELTANILVDKPNPVYSAAGCINYDFGPVGIGGNKFTYQGNAPSPTGTPPPPPAGQPYSGQESFCAFNGQRSENSYTVDSTPLWFYDSGYVCHQLDVMFPPTGGTNNDEFEKHILGIYWDQASYARVMDPVLFADYQITGAGTVNSNLQCAAMTTLSSPYCDTLTLPISGDVSAIQNGLASGQRFRACLSGTLNGSTVYSSAACNVFPYQSPSQSASTAPGGTLPANPTIYVMRMYTDANNLVWSQPPSSIAVPVDTTCPTSGNCSITVPCPAAILNATGYDVFARNGATGAFYRQNTAGPIPLGATCTPFTFGTTANPLQTTGLTATSWNLNIVSVIAADNVAHTLTINSNWATDVPSPTHNPVIAVMRQLTGIPADTGTTTTTLVCNSCNFNSGLTYSTGSTGVPNSAVVYCGLTATGDAGAPLYSLAPQRGSTIQSIPSLHQINLTTAINCAPGTNFEIRMRKGPPGGVKIFAWANTPYDVWKRFGNFIGADSIMWLAENTAVTGGNPVHCCVFSSDPGSRRENGLSLLSCHRAINVLNDLSMTGGTTALAPQPNCASPTAAKNNVYPAFEMVENMTGTNYGRGTHIGSFLDGVLGYALVDWWQDPLMGVTGDPQFPFWTNRLTNALWAYYSLRNSYAAWCQPSWPHEWAYLMEDAILGACGQSNGNYQIQFADGTRIPVNDYWSVMGNILPLFAFFYQYTGNAQIPPVGGMVQPPWRPCYALGKGTGVPDCSSITYGQAYEDMASWIFVHMNSTVAWSNAGAKTLGEMGLWQDRAIGWMGGNGGAPPSTLTTTTSSLPQASIGIPYNATMAASGGTPPYSWNANVLPMGLTMNSAGVISGTPTAYGTTTITFSVTDSATPTPTTATVTLPLVVTATVPVSAYPGYLTGIIP